MNKKDSKLAMSAKTKNAVFGSLFALTLLLAVFPPFYLGIGNIDASIFGIPFAVAYQIFIATFATLLIGLLYLVEDARGELD